MVAIYSGSVLAGELPARALALVTEWAPLRWKELQQAWDRARNLEAPGPIPPLV